MFNVQNSIKGRGAQINTQNPFSSFEVDGDPMRGLEPDDKLRTKYLAVHPKTIINKVKSPDVPMDYSINPYQGCEHGCVYCYARNTHPYWGYSAGMDFEQKILYKVGAEKILEKKFKSKRYQAKPIMLSGNTDCYQPIEAKLKTTQQLLKLFLRYKHPVGIITKNSLILRDLPILKELAEQNLVRVAISITTLNEELKKTLEPRTSSIIMRLKALRTLSAAGIPVSVMMAPIIPGLNDHEILPLAKVISEAGALSMGFTMVRLNGDVEEVFQDWIEKVYPDKAQKVMNMIKEVHGGKASDSRFKTRMTGEGTIAKVIQDQFNLARMLYFKNKKMPALDSSLHKEAKSPQLKLF